MTPRNVLNLLRFVDRTSRAILVLGVLAGALLFGIELCFAYSLQTFLAQIGSVSSNAIQVPFWLVHQDLEIILIAIAVLGCLRAFLQWGQYYMQGIATHNIRLILRTRILRYAFFSSEVSSPQTLTLFGERCEAAAASFGSLQGTTMQLTTALSLLASMIYISPQVTLVSLLILGLVAIPLRRFNGTIAHAGIGVSEEAEHVYARLMISIKNLLLLQIYGTNVKEYEYTTTALNKHFRHFFDFYRLSGLKFVIPQVLGVILICLITWIIRINHFVSTTSLVTYFYLFVRFIQIFSDLSRTGSNFRLYWPQLASLIEWWQANGQKINAVFAHSTSTSQKLFNPVRKQVGWELNKVSFRYPDKTSDVLRDLSLAIKPKEMLVIMGASGAGKSTLLQLLLGLSQPTSGEIRLHYGEETICLEHSKQTLLNSIGFVGPDPFIIEGTVQENLLYGVQTPPSDEELRSAIELAHCDFIFELKGGLQHRLTEQGAGLSAGQKQRLALGRALLRKPTALFLDEATANLDRQTEARLVESLKKLKEKMTIIAVTHRDALGEIADQVLHLQHTFRHADA